MVNPLIYALLSYENVEVSPATVLSLRCTFSVLTLFVTSVVRIGDQLDFSPVYYNCNFASNGVLKQFLVKYNSQMKNGLNTGVLSTAFLDYQTNFFGHHFKTVLYSFLIPSSVYPFVLRTRLCGLCAASMIVYKFICVLTI